MFLPKESLRELYDRNYQRRQTAIEAAGRLTPDEFTRDVKTGWRSVRNTLLHIMEAETFWVDHILQHRSRPDWDFTQFPNAGSVAALAGEVEARTRPYLDALTDAVLREQRTHSWSNGFVANFTVSEALLHVVTHDFHHRGQVMALIRQLGYEPPEVDLL